MVKAITRLSKEEMQKIHDKICENNKEGECCSNCPLYTYIGCFYDFKLNGYLDIYVDVKTLKRYVEKDKSE